MSWFEKIGLIEKEEETLEIPQTPTVEVVEAEVNANTAADVVNEVYAQNNMGDKSNSIYTVKEYIEALPEEMPTATKQKTVSGILTVSKKSVSDLVTDAYNRIDTLGAAKAKIVGECNDEIATAMADIETMKQAIEAANIKIKENQDIIASTTKAIEDEVKVMNGLVDFCNGMEAK